MMNEMADRWMDGLVDRQMDRSYQEVTAWLGRAVWEVMDGTQRTERDQEDGRKKEVGQIDGQTD